MNKLTTLLVTVLISVSSFAQNGINYKAVIKDNLGNVVANKDIEVRFIIEKPNGQNEYIETHDTTSDANGIIILNIGEGTPGQFNDFDAIDWGEELYSLEVSIKIDVGGSYIVFEETPFKTVPYALHAANISGLEKITENDGTEDNTGWRLIGQNPDNYGPIGENAVDLSVNDLESDAYGATGRNAVSMGRGTEASGRTSTALGSFTVASGINSAALGSNTKAESFASFAIGRGNIGGGFAGVENNPNSSLSWVHTDPLFEIGNSMYGSSNALTVLKNGNVGIGNHQPTSLLEVAHETGNPTVSNMTNAFSIRNSDAGTSWQFYSQYNNDLHLYNNGVYRGAFLGSSGAYAQTSDRRVKKDITPLDNGTLNKVMQLNPVSYLMIDQTDSRRNLGLISQEVQEVFPSITHYVEESDLLTLSYTELIPILIKALQEQQVIIEAQNKKNTDQDKTITALLQRMEQLELANNQ